ncbi:MAG TPA: ABC transporter permease, partial [Actinotalea sp.]
TLAESAIVIVELFGLGFVALRVAVYLFRYGSIEYSKKLSLRSVLGRRRPVRLELTRPDAT